MKRKKITIIPFITNTKYDYVSYYTFIFEGEEESEAAKFATKHRQSEFMEEYQGILLAMWNIGDYPADKSSFGNCSKVNDNVMSLPGSDDENPAAPTPRLLRGDLRVLRQYCIVLNESIVILGNGDIKNTPTYNEDPKLLEYVNILLAIDKKLSTIFHPKDGKKSIENLNFEIIWE